jgi:ABC-type Fe3+ transport system permease subunit
MALVWMLAFLEMGMAWILGGDTLCLAVGIYSQGAGDSHVGRPGSDAGK